MKDIEIRAALYSFVQDLNSSKASAEKSEDQLRKKVCQIAEKTLSAMELSKSIAEETISQVLSELEPFLIGNESLWENHTLKTFLLAIKELGVASDEALAHTFIHLQERGVDYQILSHFIYEFPQILTFQFQGSVGNTLLHYYADQHNLEVCQFLLSKGMDLKVKNREGYTIFHRMARNQETPKKMYKLATSSGINILDNEGNTALHVAVRERNMVAIKAFFELSPLIYSKNKMGFYLLHLAMFPYENGTSRREVAQFLMDKEVSLFVKDIEGNSPLHLAAMFGTLADIEFFEPYSIMLNKENHAGQTPLDLLVKRGDIVPPDFLLDSISPKRNTLVKKGFELALQHNKWPLVRYFLEKGKLDLLRDQIDVKALLISAFEAGQDAIVLFILKKVVQLELPATTLNSVQDFVPCIIRELESNADSVVELLKLISTSAFSNLLSLVCINLSREKKWDILATLVSKCELSKPSPEINEVYSHVAESERWDLLTLLTSRWRPLDPSMKIGSNSLALFLVKHKKWDLLRPYAKENPDFLDQDVDGKRVIEHAFLDRQTEIIETYVNSCKNFSIQIEGSSLFEALVRGRYFEKIDMLADKMIEAIETADEKEVIYREFFLIVIHFAKEKKWEKVESLMQKVESALDNLIPELRELITLLVLENQWSTINLSLDLINSSSIYEIEIEGKSLLSLAIENNVESVVSYYAGVVEVKKLSAVLLQTPFLDALLEQKMFGAIASTLSRIYQLIDLDSEQNESIRKVFVSLINKIAHLKDRKIVDEFLDRVGVFFFKQLKVVCRGADLITPLLIREKKFESIIQLCEKGELSFDSDIQGRTLISYAIESGDADLCNQLIKMMLQSYDSFDLLIDGKTIIDLLFDFRLNESITFLISQLEIKATTSLIINDKFEQIIQKIIIKASDEKQWVILKDIIEKLSVDCSDLKYKNLFLTSYLLNEEQYELAAFIIENEEGLIHPGEVDIRATFESVIKNKNAFLIHRLLDYFDEMPREIDGKPIEQCFVEARAWGALFVFAMRVGVENISVEKEAVIALCAEDGHFDCAHFLISEGFPFENVLVKGMPLLHIAIREKNFPMMNILIQKGANINQKDEYGRAAIYYALQDYPSMIWVELIRSGATLTPLDLNFNLTVSENLNVLKHYLEKVEKDEGDFNVNLMEFLISKRSFVPVEDRLAFGVREHIEVAGDFLKYVGSLNLQAEEVIPPVQYSTSDMRAKDRKFEDALRIMEGAFAAVSDKELEGVLGIDEKVITPQDQRENFARYIQICLDRAVITGVIPDQREKVYEPMRNAIEHMAKAWPQLRKDEQLSLLTNFSRIGKTYCIDPYRKASLWAFNMVKQHSIEEGNQEEVVVATGSEVDAFRNELLIAASNWTVLQMQAILGEADGTTDTHAINWAYKHFGPQVGLKISKLEEGDIHLGWGRTQLGRYLLNPGAFEQFEGEQDVRQEEILVEKLRDLFWAHFRGNSFQHFFKYIQAAFQKSSEQTLNYYYFLVDAEKGIEMAKAKGEVADAAALEKYLAMGAKLKQLRSKLSSLKGSLRGVETQLKFVKSKTAVAGLSKEQGEIQAQIEKIEQVFDEGKEVDVLGSEVVSLDLIEKAMKKVASGNEESFEKCDQINLRAEEKKLEFGEKHIDIMYVEPYSSFITIEGVFEFYKMVLKYERTRG